MNNRIKLIRSINDLSQEEFGKRIGIKSRSHISGLENGSRHITDRIIKDICREFNVREKWLHDGSGEMFERLSKEERVASMLGDIFTDKDSEIYDFRLSVFERLGMLDIQDWKVIRKIVDGIFKE